MEKSWFTSRKGKKVRFTFDYCGEVVTKDETIKDDSDAAFMWLMSEKGYKFSDIENE